MRTNQRNEELILDENNKEMFSKYAEPAPGTNPVLDFSSLKLPAGLTHLTLNVICDNNTMIRNIDHIEHFNQAGVQHETKKKQTDTKELHYVDADATLPSQRQKHTGIVVTNIELEDKVLAQMDDLMVGKTNKDAAIIINGALAAGAILKPTYTQFSKRYGNNIMSSKTFYKFVGLDKLAITKEEIEPIKLIFEQL